MHLINKRRNTISRLIINSYIKSLYQSDDIMKDWQFEINQRIKDIYDLMEESFRQYQKNDLKRCFDLVKLCGQLVVLDSVNLTTSHKICFKDKLSQYKRSLQSNMKFQGLFNDPKQIIVNGKIDLIRFKKFYKFYSTYLPGTKEGKNVGNILDNINHLIRQDESRLAKQLTATSTNKSKNASIDDNTAIDKIYEGIESLLSVTKQLSEIIKESEGNKNNHRWKAPQISNQTKNKIANHSKKIVQSLQSKIRQKIKQGGPGYKEAQSLIGKLSYMYQLFSSVPQVNSVLQSKNIGQKNLVDHLYDQLREKIQQRRKNYLYAEKIDIMLDFTDQFITFSPKQQLKIQDRIVHQFKIEIDQIITKCKSENEYSILSKVKEVKSKAGNLTSGLRKIVEDEINKIYNEEIENRKKSAEYTQKNFKFEKAYELMGQQEIPQVLQAYKRKLQEFYESHMDKMRGGQPFNEKQSILEKLFVKFVNGKKIEQGSQYKLIYDLYLQKVIDIFKEKIKNSLKNIEILVNKRQVLASAINNGKGLEQLLLEVNQTWEFFRKNRETFTKFQQTKKEELNKLLRISDAFFEKNLAKKEVSSQKIKEAPKILVSWRSNQGAYLELTKVLETQYTFYVEQKEILERIIRNKNSMIDKWTQIEKTPTQLLELLDKVKFYNQLMNNKSSSQRQKVFQEIEQCFEVLSAYEKTNIFPNLDSQIQKRKEAKLSQITKGIQRSCQQIQRAFNDVNIQFSKQIDLTTSILTAMQQKMTYLKIEEDKKTQIRKLTDTLWMQNIEKMDKAFEVVKERKKNMDQALNKIKNSLTEKQNIEITSIQAQFQRFKNIKYQEFQSDFSNEKDEGNKKKIQTNYDNEMHLKNNQKKEKIQKIKEGNHEKFLKAEKEQMKKQEESIQIYCDSLLIMYKSYRELSQKQNERAKEFSQKLKQTQKAAGKRTFNQIYQLLRKTENNYANFLLNSHEVFKNSQVIQWVAKVRGNDIQYVLKELKVSQNKKSSLRQMFDSYNTQFDKWTKDYQQCPSDNTIQNLIKVIKDKAYYLEKYYHNNGQPNKAHSQKLLAGIFALWTIINSEIEEGFVQFYYKPHPAQVVSIFLCLSFLKSEQPKILNSKMAQIGTGQGKSVVLAGISAYLALCGFEVNTVCYSAYLTERDKQTFSKLYDKLQIQPKIKYGTYDSVCQSLLNKKQQQSKGLRDAVKQIIEGKSNIKQIFLSIIGYFQKIFLSKNNKESSRKIMLIDEVDVFFDPSFFGSLYCPDICLVSDEISNLLEKVWSQFKLNHKQGESFVFKNMLTSSQYQAVIKKFSKLDGILSDQVCGMILGCKACDHDYVVREDLIQYKNQDGISSKINYGFQTLFAYMKEADRDKITKNSMKNALKISLIIAQFSYSLLPKYFRSIIGVTGTYEDMSELKKNWMTTKFNVKEYFVIPSVYGKEKRRKINPPKICQADQHLNTIVDEIKSVHQTGRPVLVFFKNATDLESFFNSQSFQSFQSRTTFLNETHPSNDRDYRIQKTCNKGNITLMTNCFGRGTDFIVYDESLYKINDGGLHVIQTFVSLELSQQVQIQGRTARQGNPGTYTLIISKKQLEKLNLHKTDIKNFDGEIRKARLLNQENQWKESIKRLNQAQMKHNKCIEIYKNQKTSEKKLIEYIGSLNKYQQIRNYTCRTVIMIDGTFSMSSLIKKLLSILNEVIKDIIEITEKLQNSSTSQLQLFVYRNYNCPYETVFQCTPFETSAKNLVEFLKKIQVDGGLGRQALQLGYWHVNKIADVDQVIIIGDAPANTPEDTINNRKIIKKQNYWQSKKIPLLSSEHQLKKIVSQKIPIHSFYINSQPDLGTKEYFEQVSKRTSGIAEQFLINSSGSSKKLSQFIGERILEKLAINENLRKEMVIEYRKRHSL